MAVLMMKQGQFETTFAPIVGRISESDASLRPSDEVRVLRRGQLPEGGLSEYAAVLAEGERFPTGGRIGFFDDLSHVEPGDLVLVDSARGRVRTLFRNASPHNALFLTDRCNSNCLMCSQPPKNSAPDHLDLCLRMIELLSASPPARLGITGGEPTLLGEGFLQLLAAIKHKLPQTIITALSNGRTLANPEFVSAIARVAPTGLRFTIPLHADVPDIHDYIAQANGALNETLGGFYNLAAAGMEVEARVVLHALSIPRLPELAEFIYRKLPFVQQVAFMGLEHMGYVKKNLDKLAIDPLTYGRELRQATLHLSRRGIAVSIYNLPYCAVPEEVWGLCRKSISDHKQLYSNECQNCIAFGSCSGFFTSAPDTIISRIVKQA